MNLNLKKTLFLIVCMVVPIKAQPLIEAIKRDAVDQLPALVAQAQPDEQVQALVVAAKRGSLQAVEALLNAGIDPNTSYANDTPLMVAAERGNLPIIQALLKKGALVTKKRLSSTMIMLASAANQPAVILELAKSPAVNTIINDKDDEGMTGLYRAVITNKPEIVKALVQVPGINVDEEYCVQGPDMRDCQTALLFAAQAGNADLVKLLLDAGANAAYQDGKKFNAASYAQSLVESPQKQEIIRLLQTGAGNR